MGCIIAVIFAALAGSIFTTIVVYLGIYAFKNPDPGACWVVRDLDSAAKTKQ